MLRTALWVLAFAALCNSDGVYSVTSNGGRALHRLVGGHLKHAAAPASDSSSDLDDAELLTASETAQGGQTKKAEGGGGEEEKKTLSQQVAEGKYGLIQKELFSKPVKRPGVISYESNSEVPKDTINNLGGLSKNDIWLAENHLLVIKGGVYPPHEDGGKDNEAPLVWAPIDDYVAPERQVKIPKNPKVPPPFPVQLEEGGPLQIIGTNSSRTLNGTFDAPTYAIPPSQGGYQYEEAPQGPYPAYPAPGETPFPIAPYPPIPGEYYPGGGPPLNASQPPFFPPFSNQSELDEDDPSIYYPPPYSFYYPKDNSSVVPAGPLVPGIVLPPPPNFFAPLEKQTKTSSISPKQIHPTTTALPPTSTPQPQVIAIYPVNQKPTSTVLGTSTKPPYTPVIRHPSHKKKKPQNNVTILRPVKPTITSTTSTTTTKIPKTYYYQENEVSGKPFAVYGPPSLKSTTTTTVRPPSFVSTTQVPLKVYFTSKPRFIQRTRTKATTKTPQTTTTQATKPPAQYYYYEEEDNAPVTPQNHYHQKEQRQRQNQRIKGPSSTSTSVGIVKAIEVKPVNVVEVKSVTLKPVLINNAQQIHQHQHQQEKVVYKIANGQQVHTPQYVDSIQFNNQGYKAQNQQDSTKPNQYLPPSHSSGSPVSYKTSQENVNVNVNGRNQYNQINYSNIHASNVDYKYPSSSSSSSVDYNNPTSNVDYKYPSSSSSSSSSSSVDYNNPSSNVDYKYPSSSSSSSSVDYKDIQTEFRPLDYKEVITFNKNGRYESTNVNVNGNTGGRFRGNGGQYGGFKENEYGGNNGRYNGEEQGQKQIVFVPQPQQTFVQKNQHQLQHQNENQQHQQHQQQFVFAPQVSQQSQGQKEYYSGQKQSSGVYSVEDAKPQYFYVTSRPEKPRFRLISTTTTTTQPSQNFGLHIAKIQEQIQSYYTTERPHHQIKQKPSAKPVYQFSFEAAGYKKQEQVQEQDENDKFRPLPHYSVQIQPAIEVIPTASPSPYHQNSYNNDGSTIYRSTPRPVYVNPQNKQPPVYVNPQIVFGNEGGYQHQHQQQQQQHQHQQQQQRYRGQTFKSPVYFREKNTSPKPVFYTSSQRPEFAQQFNQQYNQQQQHAYVTATATATPRPISQFSFGVTQNPIYYTKQDESYFDENTKKYFATFGKKIPGVPGISGTTPIYSGEPTTQKNEYKKPISLEGDTLVNYVQQRPLNPNAELIHTNPHNSQAASLEGDLRVNYNNQQQQGILPNPDAELISNSDKDSNSFISYQLPGDEGAHFYFLTPQLAQKRDQGSGYYFSRAGRSDNNQNQNQQQQQQTTSLRKRREEITR